MRYIARCFILLLGTSMALPGMAATLLVRDAVTGAPVDARVSFTSIDETKAADAEVRIERVAGVARNFRLAEGSWRIDVDADGYRPLRTRLIESSDALPVTLLLDPIETPAKLEAITADAKREADGGWIQGYVRHADTGEAIAGAMLGDGRSTTRSDSDGYFRLALGEVTLPKSTPLLTRPLPEALTLIVDAPGFAPWQRSGLSRLRGVQTLLVALGSEVPEVMHVELGVRDRVFGEGVGADENALPVAADDQPAKATLLAPSLAPPATIRVGYGDAGCTVSCCTASCTHACELSLETYVRRGLDSEWIASWNAQSLRAGSIAYRSYGAARTQNPMNASFDICSSACCQVNDAGTHANTDAAVARTPGLMLSRQAAQIFASEYSAENNAWDDPGDGLHCSNVDLSCGDGFVGSPSPGWPCLADAVAAGRGCFGHGRGMSQWGSQRWAIHDTTPQNWRWIVDHYYNDNGDESGAGSGLRTSELTSPLSLSAIVADPAQASAGTLLSLSALAASTAGETHQHLLIGASLYAAGVGYIDDPANDSPLVLDPGSQLVARGFSVPPGTPPGSYDVLYALWLDVDEDGMISSIDLPLAFISEPAAFSIPQSALFADGFEGELRLR
ncbi:MAG: SpoIID/LytB domain-containing protein [Lysobacteraceae bacterium]